MVIAQVQGVLLVIPADGSNHSRIFSAPYKENWANRYQPYILGEVHDGPVWSPDGRRLAFLYHHKDHPLNDSEGCGNKNPGAYLCIVDLEGSAPIGQYPIS